MDQIGVLLTLFFGGLGVAYGGYSMHADYPFLAVLSYVVGGACVAASIDLAIRRGVRHETQPAVMSSANTSRANRPPVAVGPSLPMVIPPDTDHQLVEVSPFELLGFFEDHLSPQARKLAEVYLGQRIPIYAKVHDVHVFRDRANVYGSIENLADTQSARRQYTVVLQFDLSLRDKLLILKRDQFISVVGEISNVEARVLTLSNCELRSNV